MAGNERNHFVLPSTVRLLFDNDDPDGDYIEVKGELTYEEQQRLVGAGISGFKVKESELSEYSFDWPEYRIRRMVIYITDWSMRRNGRTMKVDRSTIGMLRPDVAQKINDLLDAHVERAANLQEPTPIESGSGTNLLS
jgi:hypothetical protein